MNAKINQNHCVTEYDDACTSNDELLCRVQYPALKEKDHTGVASAAGKLSMTRQICKAHSSSHSTHCKAPHVHVSAAHTEALSF